MDLPTLSIFRTLVGIIILFSVWFGFRLAHTIPSGFPSGKTFVVEEDESLKSISIRLEQEHYITSALLFRSWVSFLGRDRNIQLGGFIFEQPRTLGGVIKKLVTEVPDVPLVSVTIPEGSTSDEIAEILKKELPHFSPEVFGEKVSASGAEGTLFPSTYFLLPSTTEERAISIMVATFEKKYKESFGTTTLPYGLKNRTELISLAAVLEGEAKEPKDMQIVAGILLKRLEHGMRLQVDVAPVTYTSKGLPVQPINNPGLTSLYAAFHSIDTPYLYYLTGKDGAMHYAKTFAEHTSNIRKYLK